LATDEIEIGEKQGLTYTSGFNVAIMWNALCA